MSNLERLSQLKESISNLRRETDRARGGLDSLLSQLKKKFGCKSEEEAEKLLASMTRRVKKSKEAYDRALESFEKRWGEHLQ